MNTLSHIEAAVALMASAVIYGTDLFCAIVLRPPWSHSDRPQSRTHWAGTCGPVLGERLSDLAAVGVL